MRLIAEGPIAPEEAPALGGGPGADPCVSPARSLELPPAQRLFIARLEHLARVDFSWSMAFVMSVQTSLPCAHAWGEGMANARSDASRTCVHRRDRLLQRFPRARRRRHRRLHVGSRLVTVRQSISTSPSLPRADSLVRAGGTALGRALVRHRWRAGHSAGGRRRRLAREPSARASLWITWKRR